MNSPIYANVPPTKTVQCHVRECEATLEWTPAKNEIFVPQKFLNQNGWILFRGEPFCPACGLQVLATFVEASLP